MQNAKKIAGVVLKLAGVALAVFLLMRIVRGIEGDALATLQGSCKHLIVLAVLCYGMVNFIAAWRWKLLLDVQGIHAPLYAIFKLTLIGVFFSQIIPGCVSGDIMKLAFVMKYSKNQGTEAALTILVDRYIGLFGLFVVAALSCLFCLVKCPGIVEGNKVILLAFAFVWAAFIGMPLLWFLFMERAFFIKWKPIASILKALRGKLPGKVNGLISRIASAIDLYRNEKLAVLKVLLMSCMVHSLLALQIYLLGKAFHEKVMSFIEYTVTAQLGNATGIIPVTPGGMGIRDTVSSALLNVFGAEPVEVLNIIPIANTLTLALWAVVGAFYLLFWKSRSQESQEKA
ncbi:MAG: flippase-like domain-containing protein [Victivallales bacterium]|nr:flippase-like domain-containing protein [Victivallales bacterium]